ncbi:MAG: stage II sporulation protein M [Acidimicrobiia bacterium]|nr:stage II sporulation protein M [Acidimicrobiia bacterium]
MDLDRFLASNRPRWDRLAQLSKRARSRPASLTPGEVDELIGLYEEVSTQLSFARNHYADPSLTNELNMLVANANATIYRRTASPAAGLRRFFTVSFPAAVWHIRRFVAVATLATLLPVAIVGIWLANTEEALAYAAPEAERAAYVEEDFEAYYSSEPAGQFATEVLINNIQVSFLAFAAGVLLGIGSVFILVYNGANLGVALALFIVAGEQPKFWGLILPHGLLEISAVIIAGAAGMTLGWALVAPGERSRSGAFTDAARRSVVVILGLMVAFVTAGIIEGFVTPSGLPTVARVGVGAAVEAAFVAYVVSFGRRAAEAGLTGLTGEELEGETARAVLSV